MGLHNLTKNNSLTRCQTWRFKFIWDFCVRLSLFLPPHSKPTMGSLVLNHPFFFCENGYFSLTLFRFLTVFSGLVIFFFFDLRYKGFFFTQKKKKKKKKKS